jgi:hypothetical protein
VSKHIHKITTVATAFLLMLQTIAPTWALNCLCNPTDAPCVQSIQGTPGMNALEDCACAMQLAAAAPTCCAAPEEPVTDTTSLHTVSSNTCDCYVQHSEPLLPPQSRVFSELVPVSFVCGFISHSANDQYVVAAKRIQVTTPVSAMRMPRYAQIVLSVWLT